MIVFSQHLKVGKIHAKYDCADDLEIPGIVVTKGTEPTEEPISVHRLTAFQLYPEGTSSQGNKDSYTVAFYHHTYCVASLILLKGDVKVKIT